MAEVQNNAVTQNYLRGINLIRREAGTATDYYLFNAHGDVVNLVNTAGVVTRSYDYDAFGVEKDPDPLDTNHFRYCGEYLDAETGRYYLRARYYDPLIGRFTQRDTHWNTANMIYGDNPQKINEREDKLGLKTYSYAPQIMAIMQAGNLYVYCAGNPVTYVDKSGNVALPAVILLLEKTAEIAVPLLAATIGTLALNKIVASLTDSISSLLTTAYSSAVNFFNSVDDAIQGIKAYVNSIILGERITKYRDNSVYVMIDSKYQVHYVGRTNDPVRRATEHDLPTSKLKGYTMVVVYTGLSKDTAAAMEQLLISTYTIGALKNARREIALKRLSRAEDEIYRAMEIASHGTMDAERVKDIAFGLFSIR